MTLYSNFSSNAVESVETKENSVFITYSSNLEKNYEYNCTNVEDFTNNLCYVLIYTQNASGTPGSGTTIWSHSEYSQSILRVTLSILRVF